MRQYLDNAGVSTGSFQTNGFLFGGTFGIDYAPVGSGLVFGVEGDFDWSTRNGNSSVAACAGLGVPVGAACETKNDLLSTARLRVGYAFDRVLILARLARQSAISKWP